MQQLLQHDLPSHWKGADILPILDVARLLIAPIGRFPECEYVIGSVSGTRLIWPRCLAKDSENARALGKQAVDLFRIVCRSSCTRVYPHYDLARSLVQEACHFYLIAMVEKHPKWCAELHLPEILRAGQDRISRPVQDDLDGVDLMVWYRCILSKHAQYDRQYLRKALMRRIQTSCIISPGVSPVPDWPGLWDIVRGLMERGVFYADSSMYSTDGCSNAVVTDILVHSAPIERRDEVKTACAQYLA